MKIVQMDPQSIRPYENNPRVNEAAVEKVAQSLRQFGWRQPIVVDADRVIIVGHTRWAAAIREGYVAVPVVVAELSDEAARAYRIADNRSAEFAEWDWQKLARELQALKAAGEDWLIENTFSAAELNRMFAEEWKPAPISDLPSRTNTDGHQLHFTAEEWLTVEAAIRRITEQTDPTISNGRALELICADYLS